MDKRIFHDYYNIIYRAYFSDKTGLGFFLEANGIVFEEDYFYYPNRTGVGLGVGIGAKFMRTGGLVAEVVIGMGRIINNYDGSFEPTYPRLGVNIGKRF